MVIVRIRNRPRSYRCNARVIRAFDLRGRVVQAGECVCLTPAELQERIESGHVDELRRPTETAERWIVPTTR